MRREALTTASTCHFTIYFAYCYFKKPQGRTFDFCGEVRVISEKIYILKTDFEGKKILQGNTQGKYILIYTYSVRAYQVYVGKKSNFRGLGNFFLPKPNHTYRPQKSNGRLLTFPCTGEKAHMLFHDNNSLPEDQKTSSAQ